MIIDAHCHAGRGDGLTGPWDTAAPLDRYLPRALEAGIDRTIVFAPFAGDYRLANRATASLVRRSRGRLWGFLCVHPERDAGRVDRVVGEGRAAGLCGIKVHRHDAPVTREVGGVASRHRLPVIYDPQGEISRVELVAVAYPDVAWIIPHLGSYADDWWAQRTCIDVATRHANIFVDTSGVRRFDLLEELVARAGAHKVIFGSDGPELHPGVELAKVRALDLGPAEFAAITGGTVLNLLPPEIGRPAGRRPPGRTPSERWTGVASVR